MHIKAICTVHPDSPVYLLTGTISFFKREVPVVVDDHTSFGSEDSERCVGVRLDEANLYCTHGGTEHEVGFKVINDGWEHYIA